MRWSIICALNYNEIIKKDFENFFEKIKHEYITFSLHKRDWEILEQNNELVALNVLFSSKNSEEMTLLYKSEYNLEREYKVLLLMINDDDDDDDDDNEKYYFAVKSKLEIFSSEWLKLKKN